MQKNMANEMDTRLYRGCRRFEARDFKCEAFVRVMGIGLQVSNSGLRVSGYYFAPRYALALSARY